MDYTSFGEITFDKNGGVRPIDWYAYPYTYAQLERCCLLSDVFMFLLHALRTRGALTCCGVCIKMLSTWADKGNGRGGTPIFTDVFEPVARVALYPTDEDGLGTCFIAA